MGALSPASAHYKRLCKRLRRHLHTLAFLFSREYISRTDNDIRRGYWELSYTFGHWDWKGTVFKVKLVARRTEAAVGSLADSWVGIDIEA